MDQFVRGALSRRELIRRLELIEEEELLYAEILDYLSHYQNVHRASVMVAAGSGELRVVAALGISPAAWQKIRLKIGEGLAGLAWESGKDITTGNTALAPEYKKFYPQNQKNVPTEKLWVWPVKFQKEVLAVINLHGVEPAEVPEINLLSVLWGLALKRIRARAECDGLTGLWRINYFQKKLEECLSRAHFFGFPVGILMFDVDHFKKFNDTYGHQAGDAVLSFLGKTLRTNLRPSDLSARYGGEEFIVAAPLSDEYGIVRLGERLRRTIAGTPVIYQQQNLTVTISLGATLGGGKKNLGFAELVATADQALYLAKNGGRNRLNFLPKRH